MSWISSCDHKRLSVQELVRYVLVVQDSEKAPLRWAQGTHRSWLPLSPVTLPGPPQQPGPPRLMAAGQPPFQAGATHAGASIRMYMHNDDRSTDHS